MPLMCTVASAPGGASVRVWEVMRGDGATKGGPPLEGVDDGYPLVRGRLRRRRSRRGAAFDRREVGELSQEFDVVCLGGGVAGEAIAAGLQDSGLTLAVVERELVGGECPYWGCIPSKTLLRSADTLREAERARVLAASHVEWAVDVPKVSERALWMARDLDDSRPAAAMEATGARLFRGEGRLTDLRTVEVAGQQLIARRAVVIANGGTAAIPPIPGLDTVEY